MARKIPRTTKIKKAGPKPRALRLIKRGDGYVFEPDWSFVQEPVNFTVEEIRESVQQVRHRTLARTGS